MYSTDPGVRHFNEAALFGTARRQPFLQVCVRVVSVGRGGALSGVTIASPWRHYSLVR